MGRWGDFGGDWWLRGVLLGRVSRSRVRSSSSSSSGSGISRRGYGPGGDIVNQLLNVNSTSVTGIIRDTGNISSILCLGFGWTGRWRGNIGHGGHLDAGRFRVGGCGLVAGLRWLLWVRRGSGSVV